MTKVSKVRVIINYELRQLQGKYLFLFVLLLFPRYLPDSHECLETCLFRDSKDGTIRFPDIVMYHPTDILNNRFDSVKTFIFSHDNY